MLYAVIAEAIVILTLIAVLWAVERSNRDERDARARAYERTLQTMADRIQAPDRVPLSMIPTFETPDPEADETAQVGTIIYDDDYGTVE